MLHHGCKGLEFDMHMMEGLGTDSRRLNICGTADWKVARLPAADMPDGQAQGPALSCTWWRARVLTSAALASAGT